MYTFLDAMLAKWGWAYKFTTGCCSVRAVRCALLGDEGWLAVLWFILFPPAQSQDHMAQADMPGAWS